MTELLYLTDSYVKEFDAKVVSVKDGKFIVLDKTAFYPNGGGQPNDTGKIIKDKEEFNVVFVGKFDGNISHEVDRRGLNEGDEVHCVIDWERRYKLMRMHTASHLLSAVFNKESGGLITGNQLGIDESRMDFDLENFDRAKMEDYINKTNDIIFRDLKVSISFMPRSEVEKDHSLARLAKGLPEGIQELRILVIGDVDKQADGGTHVKSTKEIGKLVLLRLDNKGKNRRRVYFKVELNAHIPIIKS